MAPGAALLSNARLPRALRQEISAHEFAPPVCRRSRRAAGPQPRPFHRRPAVAGVSGRSGPVHDPATGAVRGTVAYASADETRSAIAAAAAALPAWAATPPLQRARVLFRFKALLEAHADELAALDHRRARQGAVRRARRGHPRHRGRRVRLRHPAAAARASSPRTSAPRSTAGRMRQPVGVCAGITPFNFPAMVPMWMFPVAIACGNTFVLKPSEKDPSCPDARSRSCCSEAGLPDGVFNVVNGDREAVDTLLTDPRRRRGELRRLDAGGRVHLSHRRPRTASACRRSAARRTTWSSCRTPTPANAASALIGAAYGSAGERCMAISVAVAVGDAGDRADRRPSAAARGASRSGRAPRTASRWGRS